MWKSHHWSLALICLSSISPLSIFRCCLELRWCTAWCGQFFFSQRHLHLKGVYLFNLWIHWFIAVYIDGTHIAQLKTKGFRKPDHKSVWYHGAVTSQQKKTRQTDHSHQIHPQAKQRQGSSGFSLTFSATCLDQVLSLLRKLAASDSWRSFLECNRKHLFFIKYSASLTVIFKCKVVHRFLLRPVTHLRLLWFSLAGLGINIGNAAHCVEKSRGGAGGLCIRINNLLLTYQADHRYVWSPRVPGLRHVCCCILAFFWTFLWFP